MKPSSWLAVFPHVTSLREDRPSTGMSHEVRGSFLGPFVSAHQCGATLGWYGQKDTESTNNSQINKHLEESVLVKDVWV